MENIRNVTIGPWFLAGFFGVSAMLVACGRSNNLLAGRVEAQVGTHMVVVTDCYRTRVPRPRKIEESGGPPTFRFTPCRDADVWIGVDSLTVNGKDYGHLGPMDAILVDHGVVSIKRAANR